MPDVSLVLAHTQTSTFAFHLLLGAIETRPDLADVAVVLAKRREHAVEAIRRERAAGRAVLVGWSFYSPEAARAYADLAFVRERTGSEATHVAGGVHATAEPLATLEAGFDFAALGEGERTIQELLAAAKAGSDLRSVKGLAWLDAGRLASTGPGERIELDDFPAFPERSRRFGPIEITRGCVYACSFCQTPFMFKARFRHRSVENVVAATRRLRALGLRDLRFLTPTSLSYGSPDETPRLDRVEALLAGVHEALGPGGRIFFGSFPSEVRPEHVTADALEILKRYVANDNLIIGAQSGSERVLAAVRRGHDVASIERAVALARDHGFVPNVDFIFGLPGETADDVEATLACAERLASLGARIHGHTFLPLPGTPLRSAPPGRVADDVRRRLDQLAASGALYGQWRAQEGLAADLAARRR